MNDKQKKRFIHRVNVLQKKAEKVRAHAEKCSEYIGFMKHTLWDGQDAEAYRILTELETELLTSLIIIKKNLAAIAKHVESLDEKGDEE